MITLSTVYCKIIQALKLKGCLVCLRKFQAYMYDAVESSINHASKIFGKQLKAACKEGVPIPPTSGKLNLCVVTKITVLR